MTGPDIVRGVVDAAGERGEIDPRPPKRRVARAALGNLGWPDRIE